MAKNVGLLLGFREQFRRWAGRPFFFPTPQRDWSAAPPGERAKERKRANRDRYTIASARTRDADFFTRPRTNCRHDNHLRKDLEAGKRANKKYPPSMRLWRAVGWRGQKSFVSVPAATTRAIIDFLAPSRSLARSLFDLCSSSSRPPT